MKLFPNLQNMKFEWSRAKFYVDGNVSSEINILNEWVKNVPVFMIFPIIYFDQLMFN